MGEVETTGTLGVVLENTSQQQKYDSKCSNCDLLRPLICERTSFAVGSCQDVYSLQDCCQDFICCRIVAMTITSHVAMVLRDWRISQENLFFLVVAD